MSTSTTGVDQPSAVDRWFHLSERKSSWPAEIRGGLVTFATMAYIVVLNPLIIGTAKDVNGEYIGGGTDPVHSIAMVTAGTALIAGVMTILMGVVGRFPVALAAGLGLSGFVAYTLAPAMAWSQVMGLIVLEGLILTALVLTGFRSAVFRAVPEELKHAIGVGIGLFITFIGLVDAGIVRPGVPLITFGINGNLSGWPILTFVIGLLLIIVLEVRKVRGAILIGIVVTTVFAMIAQAVAGVGARSEDNPAGWGLNIPKLPEQLFSTPDFGLLGHFDLFGAFSSLGAITAIVVIFSLLLPDFFDTVGTMYALANEGELLDERGDVPHLESILVVDSLAAAAGGAAGVSSNTSFIESAAGVGDGAKTGIASVVTGVLFLLAMFFTPLVQVIPYEAAGPALVVVGALMMTQVRHIDFADLTVAIPAFLTIALTPLTYSVVVGIGAGFISWVVIKVAVGRTREIAWPTWLVTALFLLYFVTGAMGSGLNV